MTPDELNIEIAKLLGWTEIESVQLKHLSHAQIQGVAPGTIASQHTGYKPKHVVPDYSGDIREAWKIVEKTRDEGDYKIVISSYPKDTLWIIKAYHKDGYAKSCTTSAKTLPEAICLAALKVKNEKEN